jgi:hypothetical protein
VVEPEESTGSSLMAGNCSMSSSRMRETMYFLIQISYLLSLSSHEISYASISTPRAWAVRIN